MPLGFSSAARFLRSVFTRPGPDPEGAEVAGRAVIIETLLQAHGISTTRRGEWIELPDQGMRIGALIAGEIPQGAGFLFQLDVVLEFAPGRRLVESFAGVGSSRMEAECYAVKAFETSTFHVLLAVFLGLVTDQVHEETWVISGRPRRVTLGRIMARGIGGDRRATANDWLDRIKRLVESSQLPPGTHWLRFFQGGVESQGWTCEALRDNKDWPEARSAIAEFGTPFGPEFTSFRLFLVVHDSA